MRINTNVTAIMSNNNLQKAQTNLEKSIQRLSSGYKLNSAGDDPAGVAITDKMKSQIKGLKQANNNTADGVSVVNTAEGAITEIQSMLARMKELTVQAANDVNSDEERDAIQNEINSMNKEIDRISSQTEFNTQPLINGNLSRRVYSNYSGVNQLECSDGFTAGDYGITITQDARQAVVIGSGAITMSSTDTITEDQAGIISVNGYNVEVGVGDNLGSIMEKVMSAADKVGGKAFAVSPAATNDTKTNGTEYAGYSAQTTYTGNKLAVMTNQFGGQEAMDVKCNNAQLANLFGIPAAAVGDGIHAEGSDVKASFTTQVVDGVTKRVGFEDSAVISTSGTRVTVKDVNNKTFTMDVPGNIAGTKFSDTTRADSKPTVTTAASANVTQEVTDVGTMSIHVGANENQVILLDIPEVTAYTLGTDKINVMTGVTAARAIDVVDNAITYANSSRSKLGAYQNRFEHTTNNLDTSTENMESALSTMMDTDMAEEMTNYTSLNVLTQAATSILSQANQRPSSVLQLLQK